MPREIKERCCTIKRQRGRQEEQDKGQRMAAHVTLSVSTKMRVGSKTSGSFTRRRSPKRKIKLDTSLCSNVTIEKPPDEVRARSQQDKIENDRKRRVPTFPQLSHLYSIPRFLDLPLTPIVIGPDVTAAFEGDAVSSELPEVEVDNWTGTAFGAEPEMIWTPEARLMEPGTAIPAEAEIEGERADGLGARGLCVPEARVEEAGDVERVRPARDREAGESVDGTEPDVGAASL